MQHCCIGARIVASACKWLSPCTTLSHPRAKNCCIGAQHSFLHCRRRSKWGAVDEMNKLVVALMKKSSAADRSDALDSVRSHRASLSAEPRSSKAPCPIASQDSVVTRCHCPVLCCAVRQVPWHELLGLEKKTRVAWGNRNSTFDYWVQVYSVLTHTLARARVQIGPDRDCSELTRTSAPRPVVRRRAPARSPSGDLQPTAARRRRCSRMRPRAFRASAC